ncbi:MAG: type I-U CRISPR-associated protein Cas5/Cas6 [Chloroflexi bacterium]|nr:type I-U CRISPR-associated protein Cas5/Cas6 [Rhodospirillales bacterium]MYE31617.1 type I-U CRISPR-associated protein Cas5/Cas6 [Chloroflexota bacterium]
MLSIAVEFLHGTFRGDPDGTANTGRLTRGEWPPSPARLFAALVAADGTGDACRVTDGAELAWFEQLPPPVIHADPDPVHQPLRPRFVVQHGGAPAKGTHHEYVGRLGAASRPGVRVTPRSPHVVYQWDVTPPNGAILEALRRRAARVGYVGSADSPARARVATELLTLPAETGAFVPDHEGEAVVNVTREGDLARWDSHHARWTERGGSAGRSQSPALTHPTAYRSPLSDEPRDEGEVVAWLRLATAVSGRRVSALTTLFKEAILSQHQRLYGEPPAVLHGHGFRGTGYELARYLALADVGFKRSRGRIHGLALWLPPGADPVAHRMARDAAFAIRRLSGRGVDVAVAPRDGEERPVAARPDRWLRPSRGWATAVPAIHERRRRLDLAEVARWCEHAGLPAPVAFRETRAPLVTGAIDLAPAEVNRPGRPALPYSHVELWFERAVPGPVVIGSGRQRGFGLCVPLDGRA